jgi:hypothetical protein
VTISRGEACRRRENEERRNHAFHLQQPKANVCNGPKADIFEVTNERQAGPERIALSRINLALRRMRSAEDEALSLRGPLTDAKDDVAAGRAAFGEHHMTIAVRGVQSPQLHSRGSHVPCAASTMPAVPAVGTFRNSCASIRQTAETKSSPRRSRHLSLIFGKRHPHKAFFLTKEAVAGS